MSETTTIRVTFATKKQLDDAKTHKRETYDDVISRVFAEHELRHGLPCQEKEEDMRP